MLSIAMAMVAQSFIDNNAIYYVLTILWLMSCFHIMDHIQTWTRLFANMAWSLQCSELFTTRQVAPLNCTPGGSLLSLIVLFADAFPVIQPRLSKHWLELKALSEPGKNHPMVSWTLTDSQGKESSSPSCQQINASSHSKEAGER